MNGTKWAAIMNLGLLLAGTGCVTCGHDACKPVLEAGPYSEASIGERRHVYVFLINGLVPSGTSGLEGLRLKLAERGYEKVYRGELCHTWWLWSEMKRVRGCDPEARFVLVGYGFGCGPAIGLANDAAERNIPIDSVVLLDPAGTEAHCREAGQTLVIRSGSGSLEDLGSPHSPSAAARSEEPQTRTRRVRTTNGPQICVAGSGHFSLPTQARTVDAIAAALSESAARVEQPLAAEEAELRFEGAPSREQPMVPPGTSPEWLFLHDRLGPHNSPLSPQPGYTIRYR